MTDTDETVARCRTCGRTEVAAHTWDCPACVGAARDALADIVDLYATLPAEVEHRGVNSEALVLLGPACDPEARGHLEASVAAGRVSPDLLEDGTGTHPLFVLATLAMIVRDALGHDEPDDRATVAGEADYLDRQLTTLSHDQWFDFPDLADSVKRCRSHLENVLYAGERDEKGAPCPSEAHADDEKKPPRLVKKYNHRDVTGARDEWCCPGCRTCWSDADYRLRVKEDYRKNAKALTAGDMERQYEVKPGTLRAWAMKKLVEKRGFDGSGRQLYDVEQVKSVLALTNGDRVA